MTTKTYYILMYIFIFYKKGKSVGKDFFIYNDKFPHYIDNLTYLIVNNFVFEVNSMILIFNSNELLKYKFNPHILFSYFEILEILIELNQYVSFLHE